MYQLFIILTIISILGYYVGYNYGDQLNIFVNNKEYIIFNLIIIILTLFLSLSYIYYEELYNVLIIIVVCIFLILLLIEYAKSLYSLHLKTIACKNNKDIHKYTNYNIMSIDLIISLGNVIYDIPDKFIKIKNQYSNLL
jgi:hypothetical protein